MVDGVQHRCPGPEPLSRRQLLQLGAVGLSLPGVLAWRARTASAAAASRTSPPAPAASGPIARSADRSFGKAKACIVLFAWGGMSHIDTFDLKPRAGSDVRSAFASIPTTLPGYHVCEHLPRVARHVHEMTIIRSAHHDAPSHRSAAYWNLTGHAPLKPDGNWPASRKDWPCLGSMVAYAKERDEKARGMRSSKAKSDSAMPGTVCLPYTLYDGGVANGQDGGFLGLAYDPVVVKPSGGAPYDGKSPTSGRVNLSMLEEVQRQRLLDRRQLLTALDTRAMPAELAETAQVQQYQQLALDMLMDEHVRAAFDVSKQPQALRDLYGSHICGQSVLQARQLAEAGVPLVTVYCAAGDLNGAAGAHWDTHNDGYNRLKRDLLPPLDRALSALLTDLKQRGTFDQTLVVLLTEFGRTPVVNGGGGRDHYPLCYTVAFAGAGIAQGLLYGASDATGAFPATEPVHPRDLHATIFHALGIDPASYLHDRDDRPHRMADGKVLPIFA
jgi:hypothetical protein